MRLSDTEWTVMQAVWERSPATARDVHGMVEAETGWSYSTVRTLLTRLVEKGALTETKQGTRGVYEPCITRDEARRSALQSLIDNAFGGAFGSLVQHLASQEKLSRRERDQIANLRARAPARDRRKKS